MHSGHPDPPDYRSAQPKPGGHTSASLSLLGAPGTNAGAGGRLFTPQGGQRPKEGDDSPPIRALAPQPDGSGCLTSVLFTDNSQVDEEVAKVNFARPGKRRTEISDRLQSSSYNLIAGAPPSPVRFGRRSVGPYTGLLSAAAEQARSEPQAGGPAEAQQAQPEQQPDGGTLMRPRVEASSGPAGTLAGPVAYKHPSGARLYAQLHNT